MGTTMGAYHVKITIKQPWVSIIAIGIKTIETRAHNRFAKLVGHRVAIHAGASYDQAGYVCAAKYLSDKQKAEILPRRVTMGAVLCTARVVGMRYCAANVSQRDRDDMELEALCLPVGLWLYHLADVQPLDNSVPAVGKLGIWYVDIELGGSHGNGKG